jgi:predicted phage baseplate assembly protein
MSRPLGLKAATNPRATEGGADPESAEDARGNIPLGVRSLERAVSLRDYEDFSRSFAGVAKAHAAVLSLRGGRTIVVSISAPGGQPLSDDSKLLENLAAALHQYGDPFVPIEVRYSEPKSFDLSLKVKCDPDHLPDVVLAGVQEAIKSAFSFEKRGFCQPVLRSEVIGVVHTVPGVVACDVDRLRAEGTSLLEFRLDADPPSADGDGSPIPAEVLVLNETTLTVGEMA